MGSIGAIRKNLKNEKKIFFLIAPIKPNTYHNLCVECNGRDRRDKEDIKKINFPYRAYWAQYNTKKFVVYIGLNRRDKENYFF